MSKIKCAVIGVGYLGKFHAEKYTKLANAELVAVCDANPETADHIAQQYNTKSVYDYQSLTGHVDAVSIAVPTSHHYEVAKAFLMSGTHVLVEKPITAKLDQAQELIKLAKEHNVILQVGHLERFNAARQALDKHLKTPYFIESQRISPFTNRSLDANVILDLMIHDIDIIQGIINSPIKSIDAQGAPVLSGSIDIANARINFENGSVANVTASRISFKTERKTRLFQENSYITLDYQHKKIYVFQKNDVALGTPQISQHVYSYEKSDALMLEIKSFLQAITEGGKPLVSGEDGYNALETAIRITDQINANLAKILA